MDIQQILYHFNHPNGRFPSEALKCALAQSESITPHLLNLLEEITACYQDIDDERMDYIFALYFLSHLGEQKAFPYLMRLMALSNHWPENLLGECLFEDAPRWIASTFNGDLARLKEIIENPSLNEWSRNAALKGLAALVATHQLKREEVIGYFHALFHSDLVSDELFVGHLVDTASDLYPEELLQEIQKAFAEGKVDTLMIDELWVATILAGSKEECLEKYLYQNPFYTLIKDIEKDMSWMQAFSPENLDNEELDWLKELTLSSLFHTQAEIGQNEPCYCGSGKKFKKCCLN